MSINFFDHREIISKNLVIFLQLRGISKLSLSKQTGIPRFTIDQIISGETPSPTQYNLQLTNINHTYELPKDYFMTSLPSVQPTYAHSSIGDSAKDPVVKELLDGLDNILDIYSLYYFH